MQSEEKFNNLKIVRNKEQNKRMGTQFDAIIPLYNIGIVLAILRIDVNMRRNDS